MGTTLEEDYDELVVASNQAMYSIVYLITKVIEAGGELTEADWKVLLNPPELQGEGLPELFVQLMDTPRDPTLLEQLTEVLRKEN